MDVQTPETEGATELAFAHLRNAVAHHDQEAVASISYRLLAAGHKFGAILEEAVSAGNVVQNNTNDRERNDVVSRRRLRCACFILSGLFVALPTRALHIGSQIQAVSENKVVVNNEAQRAAEVSNWARYIRRGITEAVADGIRLSRALTIKAEQGILDTSQRNSSGKQLALSETTPEPNPTVRLPVEVPVEVDAPRSPPNLVQVQSNNSQKPRAESSAGDLQSYISRGDQLLTAGDVAGARVFYQRAAEYRSAIAAERLGGTYDPKVLAQAGLSGFLGNEETARLWYKRAHDLRDENR